MTKELRKEVTMLLKNKYSLTGVIKYLLNKNVAPNEIIKELTKRHYDADYVKRILWMESTFLIGDGSFELQEPSPIRKNLAISLIIMYNSHIIKQWRHIMEKLLVRRQSLWMRIIIYDNYVKYRGMCL